MATVDASSGRISPSTRIPEPPSPDTGTLNGSKIRELPKVSISSTLQKIIAVAALIVSIAAVVFGVALGFGLGFMAASTATVLSEVVAVPVVAFIGMEGAIAASVLSAFIGALGTAGSIFLLHNKTEAVAETEAKQEQEKVHADEEEEKGGVDQQPPAQSEPVDTAGAPSPASSSMPVTPRTPMNTINLAGRRLTELDPANFSDETEELNVENNDLRELPKHVGTMTRLKKLHAANNSLRSLSDAFATLDITEMNLRNNQLTELPEAIAKSKSLVSLDLSHNQFTKFPEYVCHIPTLKTLNLSDNKGIKEIPGAIMGMEELEEFALDSTGIIELPSEMGCLESLEKLSVSYCRLGELPRGMDHLTQLSYLNVYGCPLKALPKWVNKLKVLNISPDQEALLPKDLDRNVTTVTNIASGKWY